MEFINTYLNWILLSIGLILDVIGFIISKPVYKTISAMYYPSLQFGSNKNIEELKRTGKSQKIRINISWGGVIVFISGLIITVFSIIQLFNH